MKSREIKDETQEVIDLELTQEETEDTIEDSPKKKLPLKKIGIAAIALLATGAAAVIGYKAGRSKEPEIESDDYLLPDEGTEDDDEESDSDDDGVIITEF